MTTDESRKKAKEIVDAEFKLRGNSWNHYLVEEAIAEALTAHEERNKL